ncbi:MAG: fluoride efflux transporter CrcB [Sedimenticolaceae bacterium]|nr:fluoride efflux transporter CrcB [Sedimenticolaceae bacterium]
MNQLLLIGLGGALGAISRYGLSSLVYGITGREFPWGTLVVNVVGSFFIGLLSVWLIERIASTDLRALLIVGFLGALTTFSTFSIETLALLEEGALTRAFANVLTSVIVCVAAAWAGVLIARSI